MAGGDYLLGLGVENVSDYDRCINYEHNPIPIPNPPPPPGQEKTPNLVLNFQNC